MRGRCEPSGQKCVNLVSVTIPKSVEEIGGCAFDGTVLVEGATNGIAMCDGWGVGVIRGYPQNVTLPKGTRGLADAAFGKCTNLVSVTVPDGVSTERKLGPVPT
jgi:hypothetical protein